jgi:hypothetical protein
MRSKCLPDDDDCAYSPSCTNGPRWDITELKALITELKDHAVQLYKEDADSCPYQGCDFDLEDRTMRDLMVHMINNHSDAIDPDDPNSVSVPPIDTEAMGYKFRNRSSLVFTLQQGDHTGKSSAPDVLIYYMPTID